jgi:hypothetical protein
VAARAVNTIDKYSAEKDAGRKKKKFLVGGARKEKERFVVGTIASDSSFILWDRRALQSTTLPASIQSLGEP